MQRKVPAPDLIPRPLYGDLYLVGQVCGHTAFSSHPDDWMNCPLCGCLDLPMVTMRVRNAGR